MAGCTCRCCDDRWLARTSLFPNASVDSGVDTIAEKTLLTGGVACYQIIRRQISSIWRSSPRAESAGICDASGLSELKSRHWSLASTWHPAAIETIERVAQRIGEHRLDHWLKRLRAGRRVRHAVLTPAEALSHPHHRPATWCTGAWHLRSRPLAQ